MPTRDIPFVTGNYYHVMNRGVEKRTTFVDTRDFERFLSILQFYQRENPPISYSQRTRIQLRELELHDWGEKFVKIVAYCLMDNHYHILLQELTDGGISTFLRRVSNSYTRAFNTRWTRNGPLFQGVFKSVEIENDEQLLHVCRYIHLNPLIAKMVLSLMDYRWSSHNQFVHPKKKSWIEPEIILGQFTSPRGYERFVSDHVDYAVSLDRVKHLLLEEN